VGRLVKAGADLVGLAGSVAVRASVAVAIWSRAMGWSSVVTGLVLAGRTSAVGAITFSSMAAGFVRLAGNVAVRTLAIFPLAPCLLDLTGRWRVSWSAFRFCLRLAMCLLEVST
jgi:hypothetical protein